MAELPGIKERDVVKKKEEEQQKKITTRMETTRVTKRNESDHLMTALISWSRTNVRISRLPLCSSASLLPP